MKFRAMSLSCFFIFGYNVIILFEFLNLNAG